jgi:hypothetical protein
MMHARADRHLTQCLALSSKPLFQSDQLIGPNYWPFFPRHIHTRTSGPDQLLRHCVCGHVRTPMCLVELGRKLFSPMLLGPLSHIYMGQRWYKYMIYIYIYIYISICTIAFTALLSMHGCYFFIFDERMLWSL